MRTLDRENSDGVLPAHHPGCLGCGGDNPHGHRLVARVQDGALCAEHTFDARHAGAPGMAHGGAIATVVDDLLGYVGYLIGEPAVTRSLTLEYLRPVLLGTRCLISAHLDRRDGRKLFLSAEGADGAGDRLFTAQAVFLTVEMAHFADR